jgi:myo-inositol-1(or 4)-monophosphatase
MNDARPPGAASDPANPLAVPAATLAGWLETAVQAARAGAAELMQRRDSRAVSEKGPRDLVTDADLASQTVIRRLLAETYPTHAFVGEEEGENDPPPNVAAGAPDAPPCWIVDPLDGTVNYVHRLQSFAVSIGCFYQGQLVVGVVYDPVREEMYTAPLGGGAQRNGEALRASGCVSIEEALFACSFAAGVQRNSIEVDRFVAVLERCRSLRRLGSCALNLCYVGGGNLDGYWAASVKSWDAAAGALIATEAGATLTMIDGSPLDIWQPKFAVSASPSLHQQLIETLAIPGNEDAPA